MVIVGDVANTAEPVPVSSLSTPASCADVVAANTERLSVFRGTTAVSMETVVPVTLIPVPATTPLEAEN